MDTKKGQHRLDESDHISVCICTYKRPKLLLHLLNSLQTQVADGLFTYSVVVVDNDKVQTAKSCVTSFKKESSIDIDYYNEPEQNIALARNRAVENAKGKYIAFIDDDEFPIDEWLLNLYRAHNKFNADGVLGPVKPHFEIPPPQWIIKGKLCERRSFRTGTIIKNSRDTRTGNVLIAKSILMENKTPFNPVFGRTGGEDTDFFKRMLKKGRVFIWCDEAFVYENVPQERLRKTYFLKRALLRGVANSKHVSLISLSTLKSISAILIYTPALPLFLLIGHHLFMKYLIRECDHIGKLLATCGLKVIKERTF